MPGVTHEVLAQALLLADQSPCLRFLVLRELLGRPERDAEVRELAAMREEDPVVAALLASREEGDVGLPRTIAMGVALARLGYLGFTRSHPAVSGRAELLFSLQRDDGSWPLPRGRVLADGEAGAREGYDAIPLQTAIPLRGLAMCGYAEDPRAERAYQWLESMRLPDGAWPTGLARGVYGRVGGYRRLPHSRWGCRSNTTGILLCLVHHPARRGSEEARRGLDQLLARETRDRSTIGFETSRLVGAQRYRGFITFYAAFDAALILDLAWRVGASQEDERVQGLLAFVTGLRGPAGLWDLPCAPAASRWLSFELMRSLARIPAASEWPPAGPRTPYRSYVHPPRRN